MPSHRHILAKPNHNTGRDGNRNRSGKNKNGTIQHTADNNIRKLGAAIGRQLQHKGGRHPPQQCFAEQKGNSKCDADCKQNQQKNKAACGKRIAPCKEKAAKQNQRRKASVAWHKAVRQYGNQPLPWGLNDAAGRYPCGIAAKAHAHRQCLLSMRPRLLKQAIQIKGNPWQQAEIL